MKLVSHYCAKMSRIIIFDCGQYHCIKVSAIRMFSFNLNGLVTYVTIILHLFHKIARVNYSSLPGFKATGM